MNKFFLDLKMIMAFMMLKDGYVIDDARKFINRWNELLSDENKWIVETDTENPEFYFYQGAVFFDTLAEHITEIAKDAASKKITSHLEICHGCKIPRRDYFRCVVCKKIICEMCKAEDMSTLAHQCLQMHHFEEIHTTRDRFTAKITITNLTQRVREKIRKALLRMVEGGSLGEFEHGVEDGIDYIKLNTPCDDLYRLTLTLNKMLDDNNIEGEIKPRIEKTLFFD